MAYTLIAHRGELSIFNRVATASEAHRLVLLRRQEGAGMVHVVDETGTAISASELEVVARSAVDHAATARRPHPLVSAPGVTIRLGGATEPTPPVDQPSGPRSRVRVFKAPRPKAGS